MTGCFVCACGELIPDAIIEIGDFKASAVEIHSLQCKGALSKVLDENLSADGKQGPPFFGEEVRWWIMNEDGFEISLHACQVVPFETPADGGYLKVYDEHKNHPRQIMKGEILYVGEERRQVLRGMEHIVFNAELADKGVS